jgi:hypothetical protein|tara:strand:+ start:3245 stop:3979 length:735 start_codon:yes stop_codon:yes gene_type:complete
MINKLIVQSIINKYYLGENESVKWVVKDNSLSIDFMTPSKDVIGSVVCTNFELEDSKLAIYDTKKLNSLISICSGDLLLELVKNKAIYTKLQISDLNFNLNYALSDPLLINKVGSVNEADWVVELDLSQEDVDNIIKAKSALSQVDNMLVTTTTNLDGEDVVEFVFGDESGHNNKISYQILGNIKEKNLKIPFNSGTFKTILQANKDMNGGKLLLSSMGLMRLDFSLDTITSQYYMVRKSESEF